MRDELLAFLEDGPHAAGDLAAWLEQPKRAVTTTLRALRREGLAKTVGTAKSWVLAAAPTRRGGRPPVVDRAAIARAVREVTRGCAAIRTRTLTQRVGCSRKAVLAACVTLVAEGTLVARGRGRSSAWADPEASQRPVARPPTPASAGVHDPRLRQITERPPRKSVATAHGGSFWVGLSRLELAAAIAQHQDRMHHSSMASRVDPSSRDRE